MTDPTATDATTPAPEHFRAALGRFVTGVAVMTTSSNGVPHGMTANAITSVSLDPPLVLVCVDRAAIMADMVSKAEAFALTFLAADQQEVSQWFADPGRPEGVEQFAGISTSVKVTGSPILEGGLAWVDCRVWQSYDGGDHVIVVGEVVGLGEDAAARDPLIYHRGDYAHLATPRNGSGPI